MLFTIAFCSMLYCILANSIYNSSTIFPLILFGFFDVILIISLLECNNFIQELSIDKNYATFYCINKGKKLEKTINLEDIETFHADIDIKHYLKSKTYYVNFSIKTKNSDEIQKFCTNDNQYPKGICSLFDIQDIIPNFTYNIISNDECLKNSLLYYAENKRWSDTDIAQAKDLKKVVIIGIVIYFILLFSVFCTLK